MKKKEIVYGVFDKKELIAYHDEKRVVTNYLYGVDNIRYKIKKLHKQKLKTIPDYENLYLVRFGKTFIQVGYLSYVEEDQTRILNELYFTKDILIKLLETVPYEDKERIHLEQTIILIEEHIDLEETTVDPPEILKEIKRFQEEFRYHISTWEKDDSNWTQ